MKKFILLLICSFIVSQASAQIVLEELAIGKPMPDFHFGDVQYYKQKKITLKDFNGQWLVLDFWNRYCGACITSQPKMDALRYNFKDKNVEVILVGYTGSFNKTRSDNKVIRELFERNKNLNKLSIPIAYDSVFMERHNIKQAPYIIVVAPDGNIKAITTSINDESLDRLIKGDTVSLRKAYLSTSSERERAKNDRLTSKTHFLYNKN